MPADQDQFGDPSLVNSALLPASARERTANAVEMAALWAALGMAPGIYALAVGSLPFAPSIVAAALGALMAWSFGRGLGASALRYGIGFVPVMRAAFGPRGARILLLVRWLVAAIWTSVWVSELGGSLAALVAAATGWPLGVLAIPGARGLTLAGWSLGAFALGIAWLLARGGALWLRRSVVLTGLAAVGLTLGLVVFAGIASHGFGSLLARRTPWGAFELVGTSLVALLWIMPGVLSIPDWLRYVPARRRGERRSLAARSLAILPLVLPAAAVGVAFVGALLAAASMVGRGRFDASPIADSAGFGGLAGGYGGALLALLLFVTVVPTVGLFSPALALSGVWPASLHYRGALRATAAAAVVLVPVVRQVKLDGVHLAALLAIIGPIVGVLWADERWVRGGRVLLEDLYLPGASYGPWHGVRPAAFVAFVVGALWNPWLWPTWQRLVGGRFAIVARETPSGIRAALALALGIVTAAVTYAVLRRAHTWLRSLGPGGRRGRRARAPIEDPLRLDDSSTTHGLGDADLAEGWGATQPGEEKNEREP